MTVHEPQLLKRNESRSRIEPRSSYALLLGLKLAHSKPCVVFYVGVSVGVKAQCQSLVSHSVMLAKLASTRLQRKKKNSVCCLTRLH